MTNSTRDQFCIANFHENADNTHLNPFLMTIIRSMILNILHLNGAKSIQEQLINNRWDLDDSITQLLKLSF